ncbi:tol-pal system protein YbgF [Achromobacter sp. SIMBA_011]|jgi:tol-pal system protein YbgF|uniref:Cell division coordinator CpoB n=6 Tax=Achromobacter TaxID=222 RepID=A0A1D8I4V4_9BURK|nr:MULTISPECIES: tol-pal system protein YbgF [Achromobacter]AKP88295.1 TPR repeat-containing exported protein [Achromobacter xylosoxidans]ALX82421.1 tol-pal system protein YbgF [Achromobacter denitrificans]MBQ2649141.1 tol-pal system protein YbgF [Achromobacter sp.]AMG43628.1 tol-pal system protein YbgF [Achromobacter xylosoxidans]AOU91486.1 TPR repeat-containing protein/tol-pal system protein [Achromobacter ruhlandii]
MRDNVLSLRPLMAATGLVLAALTAPAHAFSDDEARKAILDLRQQVQQQNEQSQRAKLQLADQIQALQQEIAQLRDQLELVSRQQPSANKPGGAPGGANPPGATAGDPQEQAAYDGAIDLFRKGQYKEASESLAAFTALYPASQLAPSAQFYLGSSRYALKDFKGAIEQLNAMVQKAPDNARAPDALLVIAGSQIEMNNRAGAKTTLQRIVRDYPTTPAANTAKSRLQLLQ